MYNKKLRSLFPLILFACLSFINMALANVLVSIKPIGFIAAAVADGVLDTDVLLADGASPHSYALKPSDVKRLNKADLVISIGKDMETFLQKSLTKIDKNKQLVLEDVVDIAALLSSGHEHDHEHEHHHHGEYDLHIWLSPDIAKKIAIAISHKLSELMPESRVQLEANLNSFLNSLDETTQMIVRMLENVHDQGYFVFHDAYGYFERYFHLKHLGHFTLNPAVNPGAKTIYDIKNEINKERAVCIFSESQFSASIVEKLAKETEVNIGHLDPLGMGIDVAKTSYSTFLLQLAQQFHDCLKQNSK